ncbi:hypothetical protein POPTR_008G155300v4 [Populus trichocarpa]|uniref:Uncharacterized protein n=1 Tax=Populus trichocarpa TaxID=3694 RepID=A0ACC0SM38_POPTR|nr:non-specific lipid transfer protein GPI-anchored 25 [Populus trichocarpa]KAI9390252.1 hypothetical protein POPTR_008G155300v4 [Populus trichocarpa]
MSWWPSLPVSAPPDRVTDTATSQRCDALSKAFNSGDGNCFCYLIRQPLIFGFPLNEPRVIALPSVCSLSSPVSLDLLCSGSPALPPFTAQQLQSPDDLSLAPSLPPESVDGSPRSPVSPLAPAEKHNSNS